MEVREVRADGRTIAVREWGDPAATPVLFWHALGPDHSGLPGACAGRARIRPVACRRGRYALERLASLLWAVADASNVERALVAGHSWGGSVAVFAAAAHAERTSALVLATEPADARETNERLLPRFLAAVPEAEVVRPGCRY